MSGVSGDGACNDEAAALNAEFVSYENKLLLGDNSRRNPVLSGLLVIFNVDAVGVIVVGVVDAS